ncbi:unnamed protein product [Polarella glacialis]|uniref:Uncharacterized protein n=1 Tax=Polarella glacialis TaxID=89957 RepID=A0A813K5E1_POLGL|nr:unnamed protein product [Polarella glacialis]
MGKHGKYATNTCPVHLQLQVVWCSSEVFKPRNKDCWIEVKSLLVKHMLCARVVPLRTHHQFESWLAVHGQSPKLLLCDWQTMQPCLDALHFARAIMSSSSGGNNDNNNNLSLETFEFGVYVLGEDPNVGTTFQRASAWAAALKPEIVVHQISDVHAIDFGKFQSWLAERLPPSTTNNDNNSNNDNNNNTSRSSVSRLSKDHSESESGGDGQGNNDNSIDESEGKSDGDQQQQQQHVAGQQGSSPSYEYARGSATTAATPQATATIQQQQQATTSSKSKSNKIHVQVQEQNADLEKMPSFRR